MKMYGVQLITILALVAIILLIANACLKTLHKVTQDHPDHEIEDQYHIVKLEKEVGETKRMLRLRASQMHVDIIRDTDELFHWLYDEHDWALTMNVDYIFDHYEIDVYISHEDEENNEHILTIKHENLDALCGILRSINLKQFLNHQNTAYEKET